MDTEAFKRAAAERALDYVGDSMKLGLGTGTTAAIFVELLGERVAKGLDVVCVATSEGTRAQAAGAGIPLITLDEAVSLDVTVDGADEVDGSLRLIKGGGGALLHEKIVAAASDRMVVIADVTKKVETLGAFPLPVEVESFGWRSTQVLIDIAARSADCTGEFTLRESHGEPFVTDGGNHILDCAFGRIVDPERLGAALSAVPGVVEHGLFLGMAHAAVIGGPDGVTILGAAP